MKTTTTKHDALVEAGERAAEAYKRREAQTKAGVRVAGAASINSNSIKMFMHCGRCLRELALMGGDIEQSPQEYARLSVGWTPLGFQVWCNRHDLNVLHVDFEGFQHPADTTAPEGNSRNDN